MSEAEFNGYSAKQPRETEAGRGFEVMCAAVYLGVWPSSGSRSWTD